MIIKCLQKTVKAVRYIYIYVWMYRSWKINRNKIGIIKREREEGRETNAKTRGDLICVSTKTIYKNNYCFLKRVKQREVKVVCNNNNKYSFC